MNSEMLFHQPWPKAAEKSVPHSWTRPVPASQNSGPRSRRLLAAHEATGGFLEKPPWELGKTVDSGQKAPNSGDTDATSEFTPAPQAASRASRPPGATMVDYRAVSDVDTVVADRYTLEQKIGEGGMGEVWVANQTQPVKRKVALKLIKPGMDSRAVFSVLSKSAGPGDDGSSEHRQGA